MSVRSLHAVYQARLEEQRIELEKKKEAKRKREKSNRMEREMAKLRQTKKTLEESEEGLAQESSARGELDAADELLNDTTSE